MTVQDIKSICVIVGKDIFVGQLRRSWRSECGSTPAHFKSRTLRLIEARIKQAKHTSSRRSTAFSLDAGRGTDKEGPGNETLDNRRFLTPEQLFGILKAQRL